VLIPFDGTARTVTQDVVNPQSVHAGDLNGDDQRDLLTAALSTNAVTAHFNTDTGPGGEARFDTTTVVGQLANGATDVHSGDLNGDGNIDVVATALQAGQVLWYENQGGTPPTFEPSLVDADFPGAYIVRTADIDGDDQLDIVAGSRAGRRIVWYDSQQIDDGASVRFGPGQIVADSIDGLEAMYVGDLNGDGDTDVASAAFGDGTIAWHENQDVGIFDTHVVDTTAAGALTVYADDLDGDGRSDLLAGLSEAERVVWYRQQAFTDSTAFSAPKPIADVAAPEAVRTGDFDGDGDPDVATVSFETGEIAWYENRADTSFGPPLRVTSDARQGIDLLPADLDGDGDTDLAATSQGNNTVAWYENRLASPSPDATP
jgi:hypothetical protein